MVKDHLGNEFTSKRAMAAHYELPSSTLYGRLKRGWSLKEALTVPNNDTRQFKRGNRPKKWKDHLGNEYGSVREMAEAYGITEKIYWARYRNCKAWTLEQILTTPVKDVRDTANRIPITDPDGVEWPSISELCRHWNIKQQTFRMRLKMGMTVKEALTRKVKDIDMSKKECTDHLGNKYPSLNAMCRRYSITKDVYRGREERGWPLEKILTEPEIKICCKACTGLDGHEFPSVKDMANYYGVAETDLQGKFFRANNQDEYLKKMIISRYKNRPVKDITVMKCLAFPYFQITYRNQIYVMHFDRILEKYHDEPDFDPLCGKILKTLRIKKKLTFPYFLVDFKGKELVMSYWKIIEYKKSVNFGLSEKET